MPSSSPPPSTTLKREHLIYCFDVLNAQLTHGKAESYNLPNASESYALFVTWNTVTSSGSTRLRGCIGTFEPLPLREGLEEYSLISALKDRRFKPITLAEFPKLECGVSLLTKFEECDDYLDWELGTHGIYIDFDPPVEGANSTPNGTSPKRRNGSLRGSLSATYLPEIAPAQGWTKQEAIDSAIQKAGYDGRVTEKLRRSLHVRRYRSEKGSLRYSEWKASRK